ncbi:MAG TPA: hypothetical protein PLN69_01630 [bacterium]|nr:hypothetical protein [bacterium]
MQQFENFNATQLYCPKCRTATRVKERLLLVLPEGEIHEYVCSICGTQLGKRKSTEGKKELPRMPQSGIPRYI